MELRRRDVLGAVGTVAMGALAGCPACATSFRNYDDRLRVGVAGVRSVDSGYELTVRVKHRGPDDVADRDADQFNTTYGGVSVHAYSTEGDSLGSIELGEFEPGTEDLTYLSVAEIPLIVTAAAGSARGGEDTCYFADRGAELTGYVGRYTEPVRVEIAPPGRTNPLTIEGSEDGAAGHRWGRIGFRSQGDSLPPREWVFDRAKCLVHGAAQKETEPESDMAALETDRAWYERSLPEPDIERSYILKTSSVDEGIELQVDRTKRPSTTRQFSALPQRIRKMLENGRRSNRVDRETFLSVLSVIEGTGITNLEALPDCSWVNVLCNDSRGIHCGGGRAHKAGELGKHMWYHTRHDDEPHVVVLTYREQWTKPSNETTSTGETTPENGDSTGP